MLAIFLAKIVILCCICVRDTFFSVPVLFYFALVVITHLIIITSIYKCASIAAAAGLLCDDAMKELTI